MNYTEIKNTRHNIKGLCRLARELGYKDPFSQLINSDGSVVGDLLCFFEDNPGAIEAVIDWAAENHHTEDDDSDEEVEEDDNG